MQLGNFILPQSSSAVNTKDDGSQEPGRVRAVRFFSLSSSSALRGHASRRVCPRTARASAVVHHCRPAFLQMPVAQWIEQRTSNSTVAGSIPAGQIFHRWTPGRDNGLSQTGTNTTPRHGRGFDKG